MALIIAGERSGVGKTTITLALLSFLARQQESVQSFKVGPDYIDPMFHTQVTGRPCRNLDPVLTSPDYVRHCFFRHCQGMEYGIIEGVMGLFDGVCLAQRNDYASTAHIAEILNVPVLLVIDCSRLSGSVAAIVTGYAHFDPNLKIAGVILNWVGSDRHLELLKMALEPLNIPILGIFRRQDNIALRDRHLGLIPTAEVETFPEIQEQLAARAQASFDWERLFPLLEAPQIPVPPLWDDIPPQSSVRIGIARDRAFNFYYQDNLDLLEHLGAELIPWSPLHDTTLPDDLDLLYFVGGFPEVFAKDLSHNRKVTQQLKSVLAKGLLTYAECGGLMYLSQSITDFEGVTWEMVGMLPATVIMAKRLTLGYRQARLCSPQSLLPPNTQLWGHEFHRSQLKTPSSSPLYQLQDLSQNQTQEGWKLGTIYASYLHLHWGDLHQFPQRLMQLGKQGIIDA